MRRLLIDLGIGLLGMGVMLLWWHLWLDHRALHEIDAYIRMVAPKINKLP